MHKRVVLVYDTCFLMDGASRNGLLPNLHYPVLYHVLPREVKVELSKHLSGDAQEKEKSARAARSFVADIIATGRCEQPSLENVEPIEPIEDLLGPDSETDRKLIAYAMQRSLDPDCSVLLASLDGGIRVEVATRFSRKCPLRIYGEKLLRDALAPCGWMAGEPFPA